MEKQEKTLIIAHDDLDGLFSAIGFMACETDYFDNILKNKDLLNNYDLIILGITNNFFERLSLFGYDINNYQRIVMVDYSIDLKDMKEIYNKFKDNFIWIDHHKATYEAVEKEINVKGIRENNSSAATLVYKYFNKQPPLVSKYVEDMDIWKFQLDNTENVLLGIDSILRETVKKSYFDYNLINISVAFSFLEDDYFLEKKELLIEKGKIINNTQKDLAKTSLLSAGKFMFEGYKTLVINSSLKASIFSLIIFNSKRYNDIQQILVWSKSYKPNEYKFSIRSKEHDCNVIAQKYGGNGHKKASGFRIEDKKIEDFDKKLMPI